MLFWVNEVCFLPQLCLITSSCNSDTLKSSVFSILYVVFYSTFFRARHNFFSTTKIFFENFLWKIRRPQWGCCIFAASKERDNFCALPSAKNPAGLPVNFRQAAHKTLSNLRCWNMFTTNPFINLKPQCFGWLQKQQKPSAAICGLRPSCCPHGFASESELSRKPCCHHDFARKAQTASEQKHRAPLRSTKKQLHVGNIWFTAEIAESLRFLHVLCPSGARESQTNAAQVWLRQRAQSQSNSDENLCVLGLAGTLRSRSCGSCVLTKSVAMLCSLRLLRASAPLRLCGENPRLRLSSRKIICFLARRAMFLLSRSWNHVSGCGKWYRIGVKACF